MRSYPNNSTNYTTVNNYSMPTVMFNEPHVPILLPTSANYMGDFESFKTILDNVKKAQKIGKLLDEEEERLKEGAFSDIKDQRQKILGNFYGWGEKGWNESLPSLNLSQETILKHHDKDR